MRLPSSTLSLKEGESLEAAETHDAKPPGRSVPCVLCIDDKKDVLAVLADVLQNSGYSTLTAASGSEGLRLLRSTAVHVVVLDYEMPEMNGDLITQAIRRFEPGVPLSFLPGCRTMCRIGCGKTSIMLFTRPISAVCSAL